MIRENQSFFNRIHVVLDALITVGSYLLAWWIRFRSGILSWSLSIPFYSYVKALIYIVPAYLLLYYFFGLYESNNRIQGRRRELWNIIQANAVGILGFILILYYLKQDNFSRNMLLIFFALNIFLETLFRNLIRNGVNKLRASGRNQRDLLLVGYSRAAQEFIDRVKLNPQWGYRVQGILDDVSETGVEYRGVKIIGRVNELNDLLALNHYDEIAITLGLNEYGNLERIVQMCEKSGKHTIFIPDYNSIIPTKPYTEDLLGLPLINIRRVPLNNFFNAAIKRIVDVIGSLVAIILFSPVMLVVAIIIKLTSPGPLIFKQTRVGLHNKEFPMYKFRSMVVQDAKTEAKGWTVKNDPRVTPIGKFIRKTSIDELPQFFNVLRGDMSMIGPRPERPQFVEKFKEEIPRYMIKHQVRPGITGWAQVNGYRGDTSLYKRIEYDLYYIENWTLGFDIKILILTFVSGFINKNAY